MRSWPSCGAMPSLAGAPEPGGRVRLSFAAPSPGAPPSGRAGTPRIPWPSSGASTATPPCRGQTRVVILRAGGGVLGAMCASTWRWARRPPRASAGWGRRRCTLRPAARAARRWRCGSVRARAWSWLPDPVIPFAGSVTAQSVERGERFAYTCREPSLLVREEPSGALIHGEAPARGGPAPGAGARLRGPVCGGRGPARGRRRPGPRFRPSAGGRHPACGLGRGAPPVHGCAGAAPVLTVGRDVTRVPSSGSR